MRSDVVLAAVVLSLSVRAANAIESSVEKDSNQTVESVWHRIGNFCGITSWSASIAKCELSQNGKRRTMTLKTGETVVEELVRWSDRQHSYTYRIVSSPLPVNHYESTLHVSASAAGGGSRIVWSGVYEANGVSESEAKNIVEGIYRAGVDSLSEQPGMRSP